MTLITRESAEQLLAVLRSDDDSEMINGQAALDMLGRVLARGLGQKTPKVSKGKTNIEKLERFFETVIQVADLPPVPYSTEEISQLARFSEQKYRDRASDEYYEGTNDSIEMGDFYTETAELFKTLAEYAEEGDRPMLYRRYKHLDTADRENFGWGSDIWCQARWSVTLDLLEPEYAHYIKVQSAAR